jgi:hypothetical protein
MSSEFVATKNFSQSAGCSVNGVLLGQSRQADFLSSLAFFRGFCGYSLFKGGPNPRLAPFDWIVPRFGI